MSLGDAPDWLAYSVPPLYSGVTVSIVANTTTTQNVPIDSRVQALVITTGGTVPQTVSATVTGHNSGNTYAADIRFNASQAVVPVNPTADTSIDVAFINAGGAAETATIRPVAGTLPPVPGVGGFVPASPSAHRTKANNVAAGTGAVSNWTSQRCPIIYGVQVAYHLSATATSSDIGELEVQLVDAAALVTYLGAVHCIGGQTVNEFWSFPNGIIFQGWTAGASCVAQVVASNVAGTPTHYYNVTLFMRV